MSIFFGLIMAPAAVLALWYMMPPVRTLMISVTESWGTTVGLTGFALFVADAMPLIVPAICISGIIAGFIFLAKASRIG